MQSFTDANELRVQTKLYY